MKKIGFLCCIVIGLTASATSAQEKPTTNPIVYGASFENGATISPARLPYVLQEKKTLDSVSITGLITEVCQKEGCWLKMTTEKTNSQPEVFVKMKNHAFLVPKDIAGKHATAYGKLEKKEQSIKEQKHYLEDAGASQKEIDAITAPKTTYVLIASGVKVSD